LLDKKLTSYIYKIIDGVIFFINMTWMQFYSTLCVLFQYKYILSFLNYDFFKMRIYSLHHY